MVFMSMVDLSLMLCASDGRLASVTLMAPVVESAPLASTGVSDTLSLLASAWPLVDLIERLLFGSSKCCHRKKIKPNQLLASETATVPALFCSIKILNFLLLLVNHTTHRSSSFLTGLGRFPSNESRSAWSL